MMKPSILLALLAGIGGIAAAQPLFSAPTLDLEAVSAQTGRDFPAVSLQISTEKPSFEVGEPLPVIFTYRNESANAIGFRRSGTSYSPMRVVKREFRARQLDGDVLLQSKTPNSGIISEMVGFETISPRKSVAEAVFVNERFFLERAGRYEITAWSDAVSVDHKLRWLQSAPLEVQIVPATPARKTQVLSEAKAQIDAARTLSANRSLGSYPRELEIAAHAARELGWLHDSRAIPVLVSALEIGNNYDFDAQSALEIYPREAVQAAISRRLADGQPITTNRDFWLKMGADSPQEREALSEQLDNRLRAALNVAADKRKRGFLATRGLVDSPALRREPQFWHEALTNLAIDDQNLGFEIWGLLNDSSSEEKTRVADFPIETADLKVALESKAPFQVRMLFFHALESGDPAFLRQFLLTRVDNFDFDYPRGVFRVFNDAQMKTVAAKLSAAIQNPDLGADVARRDDFGRRLRDFALRGATIFQLEQIETWLLQNAPAADAPILDAIALKMPSRTWFWLQQSLAKRPLESPYDNRMSVLVLQQNPSARQMIKGLLRDGSEQRRIEILDRIYSLAAASNEDESGSMWSSGAQLSPRATASTFNDLSADILSQNAPEAVKQAATQARDAIIAFKKSVGGPK